MTQTEVHVSPVSLGISDFFISHDSFQTTSPSPDFRYFSDLLHAPCLFSSLVLFFGLSVSLMIKAYFPYPKYHCSSFVEVHDNNLGKFHTVFFSHPCKVFIDLSSKLVIV